MFGNWCDVSRRSQLQLRLMSVMTSDGGRVRLQVRHVRGYNTDVLLVSPGLSVMTLADGMGSYCWSFIAVMFQIAFYFLVLLSRTTGYSRLVVLIDRNCIPQTIYFCFNKSTLRTASQWAWLSYCWVQISLCFCRFLLSGRLK